MNTNTFNQPIRHSSLPKLAECPCFEGKPGEAGPAAARGTLLDLAMRELLAGGEMPEGVMGEDAAAVEWAATVFQLLQEQVLVKPVQVVVEAADTSQGQVEAPVDLV